MKVRFERKFQLSAIFSTSFPPPPHASGLSAVLPVAMFEDREPHIYIFNTFSFFFFLEGFLRPESPLQPQTGLRIFFWLFLSRPHKPINLKESVEGFENPQRLPLFPFLPAPVFFSRPVILDIEFGIKFCFITPTFLSPCIPLPISFATPPPSSLVPPPLPTKFSSPLFDPTGQLSAGAPALCTETFTPEVPRTSRCYRPALF